MISSVLKGIKRAGHFLTVQPVAAFDQFLQPVGEAGHRRAVDHIVVKADGHAQVFVHLNALVHRAWFFADPAQGELEGMVGNRNSPPAPGPKHADRSHQHGAVVLLEHLRVLEEEPEEQPPDKAGQPHKPIDEL